MFQDAIDRRCIEQKICSNKLTQQKNILINVLRTIAFLLTIVYSIATITMLFYHKPVYQLPEIASVFIWYAIIAALYTLLLMTIAAVIVVIRHRYQKRADWNYLQKDIKIWRNLFFSLAIMILTIVAFGYWI